MPILERISPETVADFRAVRLRALQDTPSAFGSTYARESQLTDEDWHARSLRWDGGTAVGYLAMDAGVPCGIVCSYLDEGNSQRAHVISMWVAPEYRRTGLGTTLIEAVRVWAEERGAREQVLMVVSSNDRAVQFYGRLGFRWSGVTEPYPNDPALVEYEMVRSLG